MTFGTFGGFEIKFYLKRNFSFYIHLTIDRHLPLTAITELPNLEKLVIKLKKHSFAPMNKILLLLRDVFRRIGKLCGLQS